MRDRCTQTIRHTHKNDVYTKVQTNNPGTIKERRVREINKFTLTKKDDIILNVLKVVTHFIYFKLLHKTGHYFLATQYTKNVY